MGVLNPVPGSADDDGRRTAAEEPETVEDAVTRAREMVEAGAAAIDVVGRSAGADGVAVPLAAERDRVIGVVDALEGSDTAVSVSTRRPPVAGAALDAGADLIRDPGGLVDAGMRQLLADREVPVVLAYSPDVPNDRRVEDDAVGDAFEEVNERILLAERAGIDRSRVVVTVEIGGDGRESGGSEVFDRLTEFCALGTSIGIGFDDLAAFAESGREPGAATGATAATTALAVDRGVGLVRTHDVPGTVAAVAATESTVRPE